LIELSRFNLGTQLTHYMNNFLILQTLTTGASEAQAMNELAASDGIQQVDVSILNCFSKAVFTSWPHLH